MLAGLARESKTISAVVSAAWMQSGIPIPSKAIPVRKSRGYLVSLRTDRLDAVEMAKDVLGHGTGMAGDPQQERATVHSDQASHFMGDQVAER